MIIDKAVLCWTLLLICKTDDNHLFCKKDDQLFVDVGYYESEVKCNDDLKEAKKRGYSAMCIKDIDWFEELK